MFLFETNEKDNDHIMMTKTHLRMVEALLGSLEKGVLDLPPGVTQ